MAPELPPGRGDGRRLTQVLINLVGNAIKFTDTGEIAIKAQANNGSFYVAVRDTLAAGICGRWNGVQKRQIGTTFASHLGGDGDTGVSGSSDDGCAADADTLVA